MTCLNFLITIMSIPVCIGKLRCSGTISRQLDQAVADRFKLFCHCKISFVVVTSVSFTKATDR